MQRNTLVDRLRGYACFLVLFGHVIMGMRNAFVPMPAFFGALETFIWSFHVPLFLFLSGNVFRLTGGWRSKKSRLGFVAHKALNLGVPYVFFSAVYVCINALVGQTNTPFTLMDILHIWKTPIAQYWYLYALFFLLVLWTLLSDVFKPWLLTLLLAGVAYIVPVMGGSLGCFDIVFGSALAFGLGSAIDVQSLEKMPSAGKVGVVLVHILLGFGLVYWGKAEAWGYKELLLSLGIYASILAVSLMQRWRVFASALDFLNRYAFQIYLLHTIFTAGVRIVLVRFGITFWPVHLLVAAAFGLGASVFAAWVAKKTKVFNFFFFPSRTIRMLFPKKQG